MEQHHSKQWIGLVVSVLALALIGTAAIKYTHQPAATDTGSETIPPQNDTLSDGTITFAYSSDIFGLALNPVQILVTSYIPPCNSNFNYCLYYKDARYRGTNFESAGIRIEKRSDLTTEAACLQTQPEGYDTKFAPRATASGSDYKTSVFAPIGDAGAGHIAHGELYRLSYTGTPTGASTSTTIRAVSCYEFETRIGTTQFANYPAGSIREFTEADRANVHATLNNIIEHITLPNKARVNFPSADLEKMAG